jgi:hypothetical protein
VTPVVLLAIGTLTLGAAPAGAVFEIASLSVEAKTAVGTSSLQASSHPDEFGFSLALIKEAPGEPEEAVRAVRVDLPAGLVGNPLAITRCSPADFEGTAPRCSGDSQIGVVQVQLPGVSATENPLYNLVPPPGFAASFGFSSLEFTGFEQASLRTGRDYGLSETVAPVANGTLQSISETIWGVPADPAHNEDRVCWQSDGSKVEGCASNVQPSPFLTLPSTCDGPVEIKVVVESIRGVVATKTAALNDSSGSPSFLRGCDEVPFKPQMQGGFTSGAADSPTGVSLQLHLPQPDGALTRAESPLRNATVRLPEGMAINPSAAAGLDACDAEQIGLQSPPGQAPGEFTPTAAQCPDAAKVGTVEIDTPLVEHPLTGAVYVAEPYLNPFASLLAVYLTVDDEESGVVLKLPAAAEADPLTGRLTLRLQDSPQFPVEDLRISLPSGPKAILRTPLACGESSVQGSFAPWSAPQKAVDLAAGLRISAPAPGAATCPGSESNAPAAVDFTAGTLVPAAGSSSPFLLRVGRADGTKRLAGIEATLPPGLSAKLAGIPSCADEELARNACPVTSRVGSVDVTAGAGPLPLHLAGSAYLAGPYRGAPFSLQVTAPAIAGPFDLGALGVRIAMHVDPRTARIRAVSDPFPSILAGIPLDIRSVGVDLDRPGFIRNPTSCEPTSVAGFATVDPDQTLPVATRFQVGDCAALPFGPRLSVRLHGSTARGAHPAVTATFRPGKNDANLKRAVVDLPGSELLDSRRIGAICRLPAAEIDRCPPGSAIARLEARTPLLSRPLAGPMFLRPSKGRLPGLAVVLNGEVELRLVGRLHASHGRLRLGFAGLPDVPLDYLRLRMAGGRKGVLVNSGGVCSGSKRVAAMLLSHSGRTLTARPRLRASCPGRSK